MWVCLYGRGDYSIYISKLRSSSSKLSSKPRITKLVPWIYKQYIEGPTSALDITAQKYANNDPARHN